MVSSVSASGGTPGVRQAIFAAAGRVGVDFIYLFNQAKVESSLNPNARAASSSATGLFQFIEQSWLGTVAKHGASHGLDWAASAIERGSDGRFRVADPAMRAAILDLRRDPQAASTMAAEFAVDNRATLEAKLGHAVEPVDLYLAHFLGAGGATKFLRNFERTPDGAAAALFPAAARSNRAIFYARDGSARTLGEVRARFAAKIGGGTEPTPHYRHAELVSASTSPPGALARADWWTPKRVRGDGNSAAPMVHARLAYLMLASLGVTA